MSDIKVLVEGGKASAGAPLGPALGPLGVNIGDVVNQINEKTKGYAGMKVPVTVSVDASTKSFEVMVGSPPTSALIKKELSLSKGSSNPKAEFSGNISMAQVRKIAEMKIGNLAAYKAKSAAKEIVGTCDSMGIQVEGKRAKEILAEIDQGAFDSVFSGKAIQGPVEPLPQPAKAEEEVKPAEAKEAEVEAKPEAVGEKPAEAKLEPGKEGKEEEKKA